MDANLLRRAIEERKQVVAIYDGLKREFCPHILGVTGGAWRVLGWQFAGQTSQGKLPHDGEWRCFDISKLRGAALKDGRWWRGRLQGWPQSCVEQIAAQVDPAYGPQRQPV